MSRHLIFDLDGTLVDSCTICVEILSEMLADRESDQVIDPIGARSYMSHGGVQMVSALLGHACGDPEAELADFRARYERVTTPRDALFPGVYEGLERLRSAGFTLSICSNKPQNLCEQVLLDTGLADLFEAVIGGRSGLRAKPAPDLLEATLAQLGANPERCLYIGDSELDHEAAEGADLPFLFMSYGYADRHPDTPHVFGHFDDLVEVLLDDTKARSLHRRSHAARAVSSRVKAMYD